MTPPRNASGMAAAPSAGRGPAALLRSALVSLVIPLALAFFVGALVIAATGGNVTKAFAALWDGAFGSGYQVSETVLRTIPLVFTGLAVAVAFRAGAWNIGAEGQLLIGATAAAALCIPAASLPAWLLIPACLVAAMVAGGLWAGIAAFLKLRRNVPEVIGTIMLNFLALNLVSALIHGPMMEAARSYPQTQELPAAAQLARLLPPTRLHAGVVIALIAAVAFGLWASRTVHGYRVRMTGLNPRAAEAAGFGVQRLTWQAFLLSGALAGLGGAVELMGVTHVVSDSFSPGWGYTAIAVALLGVLQPTGIVLAALLFGALDAGASAMEAQANVSHVVVSVIQAVVIFSVAIRAALAWRAARET